MNEMLNRQGDLPCLFWVYTLLFAVSFFFCTLLVYPHWRPLSRPYGHQLPYEGAKGAVQLLRQCETFAAKRCPF